MTQHRCTTIILAAGKGSRMKSARPKVLHAVAGLSMIGHVVKCAGETAPGTLVLVVAEGMDDVVEEARLHNSGVVIAVQKQQLGTADAVKAGLAAVPAKHVRTLVLYGDSPLVTPASLTPMLDALNQGSDMCVLGFEAADPTGYGRLIRDKSGGLTAIREQPDASAAERAIALCNSGFMAFSSPALKAWLEQVSPDNAKAEFYLTDTVAIAHAAGARISIASAPEHDVLGINSPTQLAQAEDVMQTRLRAAAMAAGVTLRDPQTVYLAHDTSIGRDVVIEPNVVFGPGVNVGDGVTIKSFSHIEAASIADKAVIGPFARLRPGADIRAGARIGNFVEIKQAVVEHGARVNHLTYIGDARIGAGANIGAGTITCNFDGVNKHFTDIGQGAFIGSNSALVAPVTIGDNAYVGSGSVISRDVAPGALALTRAKLTVRAGWGQSFANKNKRKTAKK